MVEALAPMCVIKVASYNEHTVAICKTEDPVPTAVLSAEFLSDLYVTLDAMLCLAVSRHRPDFDCIFFGISPSLSRRGLVDNEQFSDIVLVRKTDRDALFRNPCPAHREDKDPDSISPVHCPCRWLKAGRSMPIGPFCHSGAPISGTSSSIWFKESRACS